MSAESSSAAAGPQPGTSEWLNQVIETVIEPDLPIVDPHHHLWPNGTGMGYGLEELKADTTDGHRIINTVFVECGAVYDRRSSDPFACVAETAYVAGEAERDPDHLIAGIVAKADLRSDHLAEILDAHTEAGLGRFRGIRHALAFAHHPEVLSIPGRGPEGLAYDPDFQRGVALLGARGLTYDSWHYHYQNREFLDLARAVPDTIMVLDHFGTPIGVGPYAAQKADILAQWKTDIAEIATCPNVVAKLGGMAMPDNGYGWNSAPQPATAAELIAAQADMYRHTIECFGPERCMFESNFPVDRMSLAYRTVWNAFKLMTKDFSPGERDALFSGTATRVYRL